MWQALKVALIATLITATVCAAAIVSYAQALPFRPQSVTWFCRTAERVEVLMGFPGPAFTHGLMLSIAKGDCGIGLHRTTFSFMPQELVNRGTSSEGDNYVVLRGRLFFTVVEGGIEVFAPFDASSFEGGEEEKDGAEPTAGQDT